MVASPSMAVRQIRPMSESVVCGFCERNMLRGEEGETLYFGSDSRISCEMCRPRALRGGWRRERSSLEAQPRPTSADRGRLLDRLRGRSNEQREPRPTPAAPPRVKAEPRGSSGREKAAIDYFNDSIHSKTIASVAHSLGDPTLTVLDSGPEGVDIVAAWDLCWYRWRVEMGHGGATVVEAGRGYDMDELPSHEVAGGVALSADGMLSRIA